MAGVRLVILDLDRVCAGRGGAVVAGGPPEDLGRPVAVRFIEVIGGLSRSRVEAALPMGFDVAFPLLSVLADEVLL